MALGRLPSNVRIVDDNGLPTPEFLRNWNSLLSKTGGTAENGPSTPTGLTYSFEPTGLRVECDPNPVAEDITGYQWRIGTVWETADVLDPFHSNSILIPMTPALVGVSATLWVAAADVRGNVSTPASIDITVTAEDLGIFGPVVTLSTDRASFINLKNLGGITPSSVTLTATLINMPTPTYAWKVDGVLQVGEVASTFVLSAFTGNAKQVRCDVTSGTYSAFDTFTIYSLNEGDDAFIAGLTNENQSISVDASGTVTSGLPSTGTMLVVQGATILSSGVTFSVATTTGCTASINSSTGAYNITALSADTATATFRATVAATGTVFDRTMTLNKSYPGTDGAAGATGTRGSLRGSGTLYSISSGSWSDGIANRVINNMLTGASLTTSLATTTHLRIGDTVQLTNGSSFVQSKFWDGSAWTAAASVIEGNLLVNGSGTFTGNITGASNLNISGQAKLDGNFTGSSGANCGLEVNAGLASTHGIFTWASGSVHKGIYATGLSGATAVLGEATGSGSIGLYGTNGTPGGYAVKADGSSGATALGVFGPMTIDNSTLVTNFNAEKWNGLTMGGLSTGAATATFTATNKPGSSSSNSWIVVTLGGTTYYWPVWT